MYKRRGSTYANSVSMSQSRDGSSLISKREGLFHPDKFSRNTMAQKDSIMLSRDFSYFEPLISTNEENEDSASDRADSSSKESPSLRNFLDKVEQSTTAVGQTASDNVSD